MGVVANLQGQFLGVKNCKNPQYFMAKFAFPQEVYGKIFSIDDMPQPRISNILCQYGKNDNIASLEYEKKYNLIVSLGVSKANESNGKIYPASLNINILKVL